MPTLANINLGGIADSAYQGVENSVAEMKNLDIHSEPGIIRVNNAMKLDANFTALVVAIVPCSDKKIYFFCENGEIWRKYNGYTKVADINDSIMDAIEFEGYIFIASDTHLCRWKIGDDWDDLEEDWGEFSDADDDYHPMYILNAVLYIGDGHYVAQVEDNIFVPDALDLEVGQRVRALGQAGYNLAIGTYVNDNINQTQIYRWNTWSKSWTLSDRVPEVGINAFLAVDNAILVQAGVKGNIYSYNGSTLTRHKRIPGDWSGLNKAEIRNNASTIMNGIPLFGISNGSGNPVKQGIYSYGSYASNYPIVLNHEYELSCGDENVEIGALRVINGMLYASWKQGSSYGVDIHNDLVRTDGSIVSKVLDPRRKDLKINHIDVYYRTLPNNCEIKIYIKENTNTWRELETINDTIRQIVRSKDVKFGTFSQVKIELITHQNKTPEITSIYIP